MCMKKFDAEKNILDKKDRVLNLVVLQRLHLMNKG